MFSSVCSQERFPKVVSRAASPPMKCTPKIYGRIGSVLGVQSSGKSTPLNTMFGLNFAVSAGRCTKGVYAQLIPVESSLSEELEYDYILVLDTEGLRAPELGKSKLNHDNELATLVIGMGDITILNIKGENTAEIEDILQISVHAFLRMRLVNKSLNYNLVVTLFIKMYLLLMQLRKCCMGIRNSRNN